MDSAYQQQQAGTLDEKAARHSPCKDWALRCGDDNSGYFWINDAKPTMIMHPIKPAMNGEDLTTYLDHKGQPMLLTWSTFVSRMERVLLHMFGSMALTSTDLNRRLVMSRIHTLGWIVGTVFLR